MAEGRFISRSIATNGQLKRVSLEADYLFGRMIPHLDREGRIDGDPDVVKAMACPLRGELTPELIGTCLAELDAVGLIEWYEVDGRQVAQFPAFKAHQRGMKPERERASVLPDRDTQGAKPVRRTLNSGARADASGTPPAPVPANSPTSAPKLSEVKVSKGKLREASAPALGGFDAFPRDVCDRLYSAYVRLRGAISYSRFRKAYIPLFPRDGPLYAEAQLTSAIEVFALALENMSPKEAKFWTVEKLAEDMNRWVRLGGMKDIGDGGEYTERGRLTLVAS